MIRGLAALEVCLAHLRAFFLVDYQQTNGGVMAKLFYLITSWSAQAVMVFFVLSGFLVGGSVIRLKHDGKWRWGGYLFRRLTRLWIVIIPALLLTLGWDLLGRHINPPAYAGVYFHQLLSGPWVGSDRLTFVNFFGNILFLQQILVHSFGTNGPLWTLAAEFWYYMLFPLALQLVLRGESAVARMVAIVLIIAICRPMSPLTLSYSLIWLFGVAAFLALDHPTISRFVTHKLVGIAGLAALAIILLTSRQLGRPSDYLTGATFAVALPWLARTEAPSVIYRRAGFMLSEMSYTLYLVHFPVLAWIYFTFAAPVQWAFNLVSVATLAGILLMVVTYAAAIWWLFERNTDRVRAFVAQYLEHPVWRRNHA